MYNMGGEDLKLLPFRQPKSRWFAVEMTTLEVQPDVGVVGDDPRVVSRQEKLGVTWPDFALRAIIHAHMQASRNTVVKMGHFATLRTGGRFHVL
jgi:hypothetical protein